MLASDDQRVVHDDHDQAMALNPVSETKLHPPIARTEWIDRPRLLQQLSKAEDAPVVLVAAAAGYGKSTLVSQWVRSGRAGTTAWVTLDPADNDPSRLWTHVAIALDRIGHSVDDDVADFVATSSTTIVTRLLPRLVATLAEAAQPLTIVLDDCHVLRSVECCDQLDWMIDNLPERVHLVMVSRSDPSLRLGRQRVTGRLAEIRTAALSFTADEAAALLDAEGVRLSDTALDQLVQQTEGWPAAVYLAALSLAGREDPEAFVADLTGSDRFIADYLSEEVLGRQSTELRDFIVSMAIFDRFNVSLANHVLQTRSALRLVRELEHTNLFLIQLHGGGWYRFHHLFATFARSALEVMHPGELSELHRRGAQWFAAHDLIEETVQHTLAAGDHEDAAALVQANWLRFFDAGRWSTVTNWLYALRGTPADQSPATIVTGAWMGALTGDQAEMRRRLAMLESMNADHPLPDGTRSPQSALVLIRGLFGYDGPERMLADARRAVELETDSDTPWYAVAHAALGYSAFVVGDTTLARAALTEAARSSVAPITVRLLALGTLALSETEQGNIGLGARLADQAMTMVIEHAMQAMPQASFAYTAAAAVQAADGQWATAAATLAEGLESRRRMPGLSPWPLIQHLTLMAYVAARSGDLESAEALLAEVDELTPWDGESMAKTRSRIAQVRRLTLQPARTPLPGEPLTARETEILHRLKGSQSLREIAADLYVSHNTVKSITLSIYRKLGAHSRGEAVALASEQSHTPARSAPVLTRVNSPAGDDRSP